MKETILMMDSKKVVIPLFYHSGLDQESSVFLCGSRLLPGRRLDTGFRRYDG